MKIIDIPDPVDVRNGSGQEATPRCFFEFLAMSMDMYEPAGQGIRRIRQALKIHKIIEEAKKEYENGNGQRPAMRFEDHNDFDVLKSSVESAKWFPWAARQILSYFEAVESAQTV